MTRTTGSWDFMRIGAPVLALIAISVAVRLTISPSQPLPVIQATEKVVYDGKLAPGWQDWSWAEREIQHSKVMRGQHSSIKMTPDAFKGLYLHVDGLPTAGISSLILAINGGATGKQPLDIMLVDAKGKFGQKLRLSSFAGGSAAREWRELKIPMTVFGQLPDVLTGIVIQDASGARQSDVFLTDIRFLCSSAPSLTEAEVVVDATQGRVQISPYIYGLAHTSLEFMTDLKLGSHRWGGNANTRHNWEINAWSHARDWQWSNYGDTSSGVKPAGGVADGMVEATRKAGAATLMTIPTIGYVAKDAQDSSRAVGVPDKSGLPINAQGAIAGYDPAVNRRLTSIRSFPAKRKPFVYPPDTSDGAVYQDEWVDHLVKKWGKAADGGVQFYAMDNEPDLWDSTHTDVHPARMGYEELLKQFTETAEAVKAVDPTARITGPVSWGWTGYMHSPRDRDLWDARPDRKAHDDLPFIAWFLREVRKHDQTTGKRSLDVLDIHYYPQSEGVYANKTDDGTQARRIRATRSLWDSGYTDESWIGEPIRLIPRMREWIDRYYPGTRLGITEWNFGADTHMSGAIAIADALGIFGKEGVFIANYWTAPPKGSPGYYAFKMFRNADGSGGGLDNVSVRTTCSAGGQIGAYGAVDEKTGTESLLLVNRSAASSCRISARFPGTKSKKAVAFQLDNGGSSIKLVSTLDVVDGSCRINIPAYSILLLRLK